MKRRILGLLLALCLVACLLPTIAMAEGDTTAKPITVTILDISATSIDDVYTFSTESDPESSVWYATTSDTGDVSAFTNDPATLSGDWNIKLDNTGYPAILTLKNATIRQNSYTGGGSSDTTCALGVSGEGKLEIRIVGDSSIGWTRNNGILTNMVGGTTYTSKIDPETGELAKLTASNTANHTNSGCIVERTGALTFKNANLYLEASRTSSTNAVAAIQASGSLTISGGRVEIVSKNISKNNNNGINAQSLTVEDGAFVQITNHGSHPALTVSEAFVIKNATLQIDNRTTDTAAYLISKFPTDYEGVTVQYIEALDGTEWQNWTLPEGTNMTTVDYNHILFEKV